MGVIGTVVEVISRYSSLEPLMVCYISKHSVLYGDFVALI